MGPLVRFLGAHGRWVLRCVHVMWTGVGQRGGLCLILAAVPFIRNIEIPTFWLPPLASPAFQHRFLRPWAENQNSAPNIFFASLSQFQKGVTWPPCPKTPGGDRFERNEHSDIYFQSTQKVMQSLSKNLIELRIWISIINYKLNLSLTT